MTAFQALVLGLLQGLSEFLPISSSAHLTLAPWAFGWRDPGLAFDVSLHVGTLVALLWYFRRDWYALIVAGLRILRQRAIRTPDERRAAFLVVATVPAAIAGLLLEDLAETAFRAPALIAGALMIMGAILWATDRFARRDRELDAMRWGDAIGVGLSQALALVPGVSRSGATISAARALGFTREGSAVFSFLLSMPVIAAAAVLKAPEALREGLPLGPLAIGVAAAAVSSWLAIAILLRFVTRHSYGIFALYRLLLGVAVFLLLAYRA